MANFSTNDVLLVRYPFTDLTSAKVRPAVVVAGFPGSPDHIIVPLTSRVTGLAAGEFALADWRDAGLHVPTAVKRGIYTVHASLILKPVGKLNPVDATTLEASLRHWLNIS
jgi:mRNA interferase MazF